MEETIGEGDNANNDSLHGDGHEEEFSSQDQGDIM